MIKSDPTGHGHRFMARPEINRPEESLVLNPVEGIFVRQVGSWHHGTTSNESPYATLRIVGANPVEGIFVQQVGSCTCDCEYSNRRLYGISFVLAKFAGSHSSPGHVLEFPREIVCDLEKS